MDMRALINLVESTKTEVDEVYSSNNSYLKSYLKDGEFDPYSAWYAVCKWLADNDYLDLVGQLLGVENIDEQELNDEEPDIFYKLPPEVQKACAENVVEYLMNVDPAEAPSWAHMGLNKNTLLPRLTWLVHFTDKPYDIENQGFTIGVDRMDQLGLTTWFKNEGEIKKYGGYNFAFVAGSRDAAWAADQGKYGKSAVLFQNSGIHAHHYSDEEDQVIFWGADVSPKQIIVLTNSDGAWTVHSKHRLRNGETDLFTGSFQACVSWVVQNYAQYRRYLTL